MAMCRYMYEYMYNKDVLKKYSMQDMSRLEY